MEIAPGETITTTKFLVQIEELTSGESPPKVELTHAPPKSVKRKSSLLKKRKKKFNAPRRQIPKPIEKKQETPLIVAPKQPKTLFKEEIQPEKLMMSEDIHYSKLRNHNEVSWDSVDTIVTKAMKKNSNNKKSETDSTTQVYDIESLKGLSAFERFLIPTSQKPLNPIVGIVENKEEEVKSTKISNIHENNVPAEISPKRGRVEMLRQSCFVDESVSDEEEEDLGSFLENWE